MSETKDQKSPSEQTQTAFRIGTNVKVDHLQCAVDYLQFALNLPYREGEDQSKGSPDYWLRLAEVSALISIAEGVNHPLRYFYPKEAEEVFDTPFPKPGQVEWVPTKLDDNQLRDFQDALKLLKITVCESGGYGDNPGCWKAKRDYLLEKYKPLL